MRPDIAEMFAELDGKDRYRDDLEVFSALRSARMVENTKQWRINNPAKWRALNNRSRKAWRKRYPAKVRAAKARHREKHRAQLREVWKRNSAAYRARKAAR